MDTELNGISSLETVLIFIINILPTARDTLHMNFTESVIRQYLFIVTVCPLLIILLSEMISLNYCKKCV
jgi:hypothetical protein